MPEFIEVTDCSDCPCLSRCSDDSECNLKYPVGLMLVGKEGLEMNWRELALNILEHH